MEMFNRYKALDELFHVKQLLAYTELAEDYIKDIIGGSSAGNLPELMQSIS